MRFYFFLLLVFLNLLPYVHATSWPTLETRARQAIIIDYTTGTVLLEKEADQLTVPSSMTKLMTTYLIFKKLKDGHITQETPLLVSEAAWRMGGSKMFVRVGDQVNVGDLLRGIIIQSGNTFKNPHGWPEEGHLTTVRDLAILARHLITDFPEPEYYGLHAVRDFTYSDIKQPNRNPLLGKNIGGMGAIADGIKTGHTDAGGYGLVASAVHEGQRLILVVNGLASEKERAEDSLQLMAWAMRTFGSYRFFKAGEAVVSIPVAMGEGAVVNAVTDKDIAIAIPREWHTHIKVELITPTFVNVPVKKGDTLAQVVITLPEEQEPKTFPLVAVTDIGEGGFVRRLKDSLSFLVLGRI